MSWRHAMNYRSALGAAYRHPWRAALAICVPAAVVIAITSTTMAAAQPSVSLAVPATASTAQPAAHIIPDIGQKLGPAVQGTQVVKAPSHVSGCDPDYGTANQCVPMTIPGATPAAKCAWLKSMGFGELRVVGTNRQDLPENAEGYACASGT
jgi:hypothetical protein